MNLGNIRISILSDVYNVRFDHATPRKIDLFALMLIEIVKNRSKFRGKSIEDALSLLDIPSNLYSIFETRLKELMDKFPNSIVSDTDCSDLSVNRISLNVSSFSLTKNGEETYLSKEITESPKKWENECVYDAATGKLAPKNMVKNIKNAPERSTVLVRMPTDFDEPPNDLFARIISKTPGEFITNATPETKIFELEAMLASEVVTSNSIGISIENGKLEFHKSNEKILKAFLETDQRDKNSISGMFRYLNVPSTVVNFENAFLAVEVPRPQRMRVVFGHKNAINEVVESDFVIGFAADDNARFMSTHKFCFAGITSEGKTLVYRYCELTEHGYKIPIEEFDNSEKSYGDIFEDIFEIYREQFENGKATKDVVKFIILATPDSKRHEVIKALMGQTQDIKSILSKAKTILDISDDKIKKSITDILSKHITSLLEEGLKKGEMDTSRTIEVMKEYNLPKDDVIRMLARYTPKTNDTINKLLAVDESVTIQAYELVKMYNDLLRSGKLSSVSHNVNLYSAFVDYEKQYKKLQTLGLVNYYEYRFPENWDAFMKEVYLLRTMFGKIKDKLEEDIERGAQDFFTRVEDDYDAYAPVDEKAVEKLLSGDLQSVVSKGSDISLIAYAIRQKYEDVLRAAEKTKDPEATNNRKGKELIEYTVPKVAAETYKHWVNLNKLGHKQKDHPLWIGSEKDRRKALTNALNFYGQNLAPKGGKK